MRGESICEETNVWNKIGRPHFGQPLRDHRQGTSPVALDGSGGRGGMAERIVGRERGEV